MSPCPAYRGPIVVSSRLNCEMFPGPLKEEDVTPGTVYPLMGKLLCFLPEHLKKKLCCVTPLGQTVSEALNCSVGKFCLNREFIHQYLEKVNLFIVTSKQKQMTICG